jgi:CRP/FNR family cyclic AMP-dependent transcriptional regulator
MADHTTAEGFDALLARVPLFADLDDAERAAVSRLLRPFTMEAGETLFRQGAPPTGLYLIDRGRVAVAAQLFGEEVVDRQPRSAGAQAVEATSGAFLDVRSFDGLRAWLHPSALKLMLRIATGLSGRLRELYAPTAHERDAGPLPSAALSVGRAASGLDARLLRLMPTLTPLNEEEHTALQRAGRFHEVARGDTLAEVGAPADQLFVVVRGALELRSAAPPIGRRAALLGPGAMTCELSVLDPRPRSVACVAREHSLVFALPTSALDEMLAECSHLSFKLAEAIVQATSRAVRVASRRRAQLAGEVHAVVVQTSSS